MKLSNTKLRYSAAAASERSRQLPLVVAFTRQDIVHVDVSI